MEAAKEAAELLRLLNLSRKHGEVLAHAREADAKKARGIAVEHARVCSVLQEEIDTLKVRMLNCLLYSGHC